jgi:aspartate-semialdehyde dehydrogenase
MTLKPLADAFGVDHVVMTSLQGCSGAGRSPGVLALDIVDNVVPYIPKEEEKVEIETRKILGTVAGGAVAPAAFRVSATCTRVPVLEGHTEAVHVSLRTAATVDDVKRVLRAHGAEFCRRGLPSCPPALIDVSEDPFRPQPRLDRDREHGMLTAVGRVRPDQALPNGVKYVLVSHNTRMGAARGALLVAEYLADQGHI